MSHKHYDEDDDDDAKAQGDGMLLKEFECPECNAHNPSGEKISARGTEVRCHYCGVEFMVTVAESGRFKFKEM